MKIGWIFMQLVNIVGSDPLYLFQFYLIDVVDRILYACVWINSKWLARCNNQRRINKRRMKQISFMHNLHFMNELEKPERHIFIFSRKVIKIDLLTNSNIHLLVQSQQYQHCKKLSWRFPGVFIVNFENISPLFLVFLLLTLNK